MPIARSRWLASVPASVALWLLVVLHGSAALGHLMPAGQGTINVVGDSVFSVLSVPVAALQGFDDDHDGLLSLAELERHQDPLRAQIDRGFVLSVGGAVGTTVQLDLILSPQHEAATDRAEQVVALKHSRFGGPPRDLHVRWDLFGSGPQERQVTFTATRRLKARPETEVATFTPASPEGRFFRPSLGGFDSAVLRRIASRAGVALGLALLLLAALSALVMIRRQPAAR